MGFLDSETESGTTTGTKFYQTRNFKLAIVLAVALILLFAGVTTAALVAFDCPPNLSQDHSIGHVERLDTNSSSRSSRPSNLVPKILSLETLPSSAVPFLLQGTAMEAAYRLLRRNWKIALVVTIFIFTILSAIGAGLGVYFENKQITEELAERERLEALEKAEEENRKEALIGGHSITKIITILTVLYGVSLIITIVIVTRIDSLPISAKVVLALLLFFFLQSFLFLMFMVFFYIRNGLAKLRQALESGPSKSIVSVALFVVYYVFKFFEFICIPMIYVTDRFVKDEYSRFNWEQVLVSKWDDPPHAS